ncbi:unnamed protein product [Lymnaea stagnalis]|uniref:Fibrinogen C-terminal domain-containing protein n=1 Tax=Lymnaea stagnalis TaxID=6523 RepID=A0AAV2HA59_LYMST
MILPDLPRLVRLRHSHISQTLSLVLFTHLVVVSSSTVAATAQTHLCSYTLVVNEFDISKCPSLGEPAQADGAEFQAQKTKTASDLNKFGIPNAQHGNHLYQKPDHKAERHKNLGVDGEDAASLNSLVKDMESKLLDEMVRSRELNSTLSRHEALLSTAQKTLESYKANFTSVFRTMMQMERKLQHQRKINRSLNKKLSNVILDVVEVNNVLTQKIPTGDTTVQSKKFAVESSVGTRSCPGITDSSKQFKDCSEIYDAGHQKSGVYYIKPLYSGCPIPVWCDMDAPKAGWLVIQRRKDGSVNFTQPWDKYRSGFGDVSGEHWLGNDNIFLLTNQDRYQLRIDLWDFSGNRVFAIYSSFKIDGERDGYKLHISGFSGSAQDSLHKHNNKKFSTIDRDQDTRREANCAQEWEAGWWFDNCWFALLNGLYQNRSDVSWRGLAWSHWKREQLKATEMKIRPQQELTEQDE